MSPIPAADPHHGHVAAGTATNGVPAALAGSKQPIVGPEHGTGADGGLSLAGDTASTIAPPALKRQFSLKLTLKKEG
jgi:hypothetical protein